MKNREKEEKCQWFLKSILTMSDPGAISVPGVLIGCGEISR